jgi:hypothetical protein
LQIVVLLRQGAQPLHRSKYVGLLVRERISELLQPGQIAVQGCQYRRNRYQRLHAGIPWFGFQGLAQGIAGQ